MTSKEKERVRAVEKIIDANEVTLSFSLLNLFTGKLISSASFFEVTARNQFIENEQNVDLNIELLHT